MTGSARFCEAPCPPPPSTFHSPHNPNPRSRWVTWLSKFMLALVTLSALVFGAIWLLTGMMPEEAWQEFKVSRAESSLAWKDRPADCRMALAVEAGLMDVNVHGREYVKQFVVIPRGEAAFYILGVTINPETGRCSITNGDLRDLIHEFRERAGSSWTPEEEDWISDPFYINGRITRCAPGTGPWSACITPPAQGG